MCRGCRQRLVLWNNLAKSPRCAHAIPCSTPCSVCFPHLLFIHVCCEIVPACLQTSMSVQPCGVFSCVSHSWLSRDIAGQKLHRHTNRYRVLCAPPGAHRAVHGVEGEHVPPTSRASLGNLPVPGDFTLPLFVNGFRWDQSAGRPLSLVLCTSPVCRSMAAANSQRWLRSRGRAATLCNSSHVRPGTMAVVRLTHELPEHPAAVVPVWRLRLG